MLIIKIYKLNRELKRKRKGFNQVSKKDRYEIRKKGRNFMLQSTLSFCISYANESVMVWHLTKDKFKIYRQKLKVPFELHTNV